MTKPQSKPKTKLTIYLIKESVQDVNDVIKEGSFDNREYVGSQSIFFSKQSRISEPKWVRSFFKNEIDGTALQGSSASGVLVIPVEIDEKFRIFALSFGHGHSMIAKEAIEPRFGLITALNLASGGSLRAIKGSTVAGNARKTREQLPLQANIDEFSLDIERDLLEGVTIKTKANSFAEGTMTGSDSLGVSAAEDIESIEDFLRESFKTYCLNTYKESFGWIDRIAEVKDPATIATLEQKAVELLNAKSEELWMAIPEVIPWEEIEGFKIVGDPSIHDDILTEDVLKTLSNPLQDFSSLKKRDIKMIDSDGTLVRAKWHASQCLYGEFRLGEHQYCVNGGKWYIVEQDYVNIINDAYSQIPVSAIHFPDCAPDQKEADYNRSFAEQDAANRILMDAKNIQYGGGRSKIELCDVLLTDGLFVHIKVYSGSSALSHLFNQGYVSSQLVRADQNFVGRAQKEIDKSNPALEFTLSRDSVKEVVFGIISKDDSEKPAIPFFSKITLEETRKRLASMNIGMSIHAIRKLSHKPESPAANVS